MLILPLLRACLGQQCLSFKSLCGHFPWLWLTDISVGVARRRTVNFQQECDSPVYPMNVDTRLPPLFQQANMVWFSLVLFCHKNNLHITHSYTYSQTNKTHIFNPT